MSIWSRIKEAFDGKPIIWPDYKCRVIVREFVSDCIFNEHGRYGDWWETIYDPALTAVDPDGYPCAKLSGRWRRLAKTTHYFGIHLCNVIERVE